MANSTLNAQAVDAGGQNWTLTIALDGARAHAGTSAERSACASRRIATFSLPEKNPTASTSESQMVTSPSVSIVSALMRTSVLTSVAIASTISRSAASANPTDSKCHFLQWISLEMLASTSQRVIVVPSFTSRVARRSVALGFMSCISALCTNQLNCKPV
jgi:hypothetical protein